MCNVKVFGSGVEAESLNRALVKRGVDFQRGSEAPFAGEYVVLSVDGRVYAGYESASRVAAQLTRAIQGGNGVRRP